MSNMEVKEIRQACFDRINGPILTEYPHLMDENQ
jgi:hypothetical protein